MAKVTTIYLADDDGNIVDTITDVDSYDLSKPMARSVLTSEIVDTIQRSNQRCKSCGNSKAWHTPDAPCSNPNFNEAGWIEAGT